MIEQLLDDETSIKCFILTNSECIHCKEWFDEHFENLKSKFSDVVFHVIDCYEEQQQGRMPFPPLISPTFYFYKNKKDFPLINQGILPEFEMNKSFERAIRILKDE